FRWRPVGDFVPSVILVPSLERRSDAFFEGLQQRWVAVEHIPHFDDTDVVRIVIVLVSLVTREHPPSAVFLVVCLLSVEEAHAFAPVEAHLRYQRLEARAIDPAWVALLNDGLGNMTGIECHFGALLEVINKDR